MEAKTDNQFLLIPMLDDFIKRINGLNQNFSVWLAIDEEGESKQSFIAAIDNNLRSAENIYGRYREVDLNNMRLATLEALTTALTEFSNRLDFSVKAARSVINYYDKSNRKSSEKDLNTVGEYLRIFLEYQSNIKRYAAELDNLKSIRSEEIQSNSSSASNQAAQSSIPPVQTNKTPSRDSSSNRRTEEEMLNIVQLVTDHFFHDFNLLITKNIDWYSETLDEEDAKLGQAISVAMQQAKHISETSHAVLLEPTTDGAKRIADELEKFTDAADAIGPICEKLIGHYSTKLSGEQYQVESLPLRVFLDQANKYKAIFEDGIPDEGPLPPRLEELLKSVRAVAELIFSEETVTPIKSDVPDENAEDSLDIMPDVNALASVITYSKVTPPLAIGLFGNWGSGKSFFMKKLRKQIDAFAADKGSEYVSHVVHIEFNSWHYSDSNLWASFVTKIFEDLDNYGKKDPKTVADLFKKLNSASEFLADANTKLEGIKATIAKLEEDLDVKKKEIAGKAGQLSGVKLTDIAAKVMSNNNVQTKLDTVRKQLPQKELKNLSDIYRSIKELDGFANKFAETVKLLLSFKTWKSWVALALFIILCTSPAWLFGLFNVKITDFFDLFGKYSAPIAVILANLAGIASYATAGLNKVQETLKSVAGECAALEKEALQQQQSEVDRIQAELDVQQQAHIQKEAEINKLKKEQAEVQATIDDIKSGKKLANFIAGRVADQKYINSLGLISWIRKDFQMLDDLLEKQRVLNMQTNLSEEDMKKIFQIDRIVLYIDDLDRCNEDVVVKVLEAIHLLLAFKLFVVVVGVDPRWMHNALENKYSRQLRKHKEEKHNHTDNEKETNNEIDSATSYDYLEKIFQIPISLNEITPTGKAKLIDDALKVTEQPSAENGDVSGAGKTQTNGASNPAKNEVSNTQSQQAGAATANEEKKKEEEKKTNEKEIKRAKQKLVLTAEEINFMKNISGLVGNTPRAVNRYINVYRIIRSHRDLKVSDTPVQDYCAVMILLGIITGLPNESEDFFRLLAQEDTGNFQSFVDKRDDKFKSLKEACKVSFKIPGLPEKTVGRLNVGFMKQKFELVQRFSFRPYGESEIVPRISQKMNMVPSEKSMSKAE